MMWCAQLPIRNLEENEVREDVMSSRPTTLVFPATNQGAWDYVEGALERGESVCCAASGHGLTIGEFGLQVQALPSIYDENFLDELNRLVERDCVARVFCPVLMVHDHIKRLIIEGKIRLELIGDSPIALQMKRHARLMSKVRSLYPFFRSCDVRTEAVQELDFASMLRNSSLIYGESNDEKLTAMFSVMSSAPKGDVIEIGCLMGKSAFVMSYASQLYELGSFLSVDPWNFGEAVQQDSPESLKEMAHVWDFEVLREGFFIHTLQTCHAQHVHLRKPSRNAFDDYMSEAELQDVRGNKVSYVRKIAAIHIDGNHDYESVKLDCELWLTRVQAGTWLILDDYLWAHGDGPYRIGNALLETEWHRIRRAFVCGKALFVQFES